MKRTLLLLLAGIAAILILVIGAVVVTGGPLADLRPPSITIEPQPDREARGRALLQTAWEAVGGDKTMARPAARFRFRDHWQGFLATLFNPWPSGDQEADFVVRTHSFDSRAHLINGPEAGVTWGIDDSQGWRLVDGQRAPSDDPKLRFMLPTVHYFMEIAQRLTEAPIARWVGTETIGTETYEVVYATWKTAEAHDGADQYLVYIDPKTGRIAKTKYTVREIARFATGTCHLEDYREVDGVMIPHRMTVTPEPGDDVEAYLHRMTVSDFVWLDRFEEAS